MTGRPDGDEWVESQHWVTEADRYDGQLAPFTDLVLERANLDTADVVLDVGCGCGAMTIDAARASAHAVGVDVSADVLGVARRRADARGVANVEFVEADAQRTARRSVRAGHVLARRPRHPDRSPHRRRVHCRRGRTCVAEHRARWERRPR